MHTKIESARMEAKGRAKSLGEYFCIVSGMKNSRKTFRIYPMKGFGLPQGGTLEEVVAPEVERVEPEPREKTSSNGF